MQLPGALIARYLALQVLRCTYWLNQQRTEAWLIAQVNQGAGNMAGMMMGGCSATLLDQGCGLLFSSRHRGATANLNIQYKAPVAVPGAVLVRASLDKVEGRKLWISACLQSSPVEAGSPVDPSSMTVCATTNALFVVKRAP